MNLDELTLGQIKQLKSMLGGHPESIIGTEKLGPHIAILQRGWVIVGNLYKTGQDYRMENASVIRNWGSTKGLGEIASQGPTEKTVLDPSPNLKFHELTVVALMECESKKWKSKLE